MISIVIPTFNRESEIAVALKSVINQTYFKWECIVVDDGSTDATCNIVKEILAKDSRIQLQIRTKEPKGASTCRNIGLKVAIGDYVIFLDSDDYLMPYCLDKRIAEALKFEDFHFLVFPMAVLKSNRPKKNKIIHRIDYLDDFLSANIPWQTTSPIWKRKFLLSINGFSEEYPRLNDPELMIRALLVQHVRYKVFCDLDYDSVYVPYTKDSLTFKSKVYDSLQLLFRRIPKELEANNKGEKKRLLANYLHQWFKYFYIPSQEFKVFRSMKLLAICLDSGVITRKKYVNLTIRLFIYVITGIVFGKPIDKISQRVYFI